ncbi:hypothetical protein [Cohnella sp.]
MQAIGQSAERQSFIDFVVAAGEAVGLLKLDEVLIPERERIG